MAQRVSVGARPHDPGRAQRAEPEMAAGPAHRARPAADQRAGRRNQLFHVRPWPPAARVRCRQGYGRGADDPPRSRGEFPGTERARLHCHGGGLRDRRRGRGAVARRSDRRRSHWLRRGDHQRVCRMRPLRPGPHRPDRTAAPDRLRRPPAFRARHRSRRDARRDRSRDAPDPGTVRRRGRRGAVGRRRAGLAAGRDHAFRAAGRPRGRRCPA